MRGKTEQLNIFQITYLTEIILLRDVPIGKLEIFDTKGFFLACDLAKQNNYPIKDLCLTYKNLHCEWHSQRFYEIFNFQEDV